jgi:hypothetical protein
MLPVTPFNFDNQIDTLTSHNLMVLIVDKSDQMGPHSQNLFFRNLRFEWLGSVWLLGKLNIR